MSVSDGSPIIIIFRELENIYVFFSGGERWVVTIGILAAFLYTFYLYLMMLFINALHKSTVSMIIKKQCLCNL